MTPAETVRQFLKAMEALDYDAGLKLVATDCVYTNPPPLGTVQGPAARQGNSIVPILTSEAPATATAPGVLTRRNWAIAPAAVSERVGVST
jgi:limonene-1,2-epoxide hydrolase